MKVSTLTRMTIHMALAAYLSDDPHKQIIRMAKRYRRGSKDPKVRRSMKLVMWHPRPVRVIWSVYKKDILDAKLQVPTK
jgi:hypothetical protein